MTWRRTSAVVSAALLTAALAACSSPSSPSDSPSGSTSPTPSPTPTAAAFPALQSAGPAPVTCEELAVGQPGWTLGSGYTPANGSAAAAAVAIGGVACQFTNTSSQQLVIAVSQPTAASLTTLSTYFPANGWTAATPPDQPTFFGTIQGVGDAEDIAGPYWISAQSAAFTASSDALSVIEGVTGALPSG